MASYSNQPRGREDRREMELVSPTSGFAVQQSRIGDRRGGLAGTYCARRSFPNQGDPMNYAALYAAESLDAYETEEWYRRVRTPWMLRLYKYYVGRLRNRYELICSS
jgi:hypothetical protein